MTATCYAESILDPLMKTKDIRLCFARFDTVPVERKEDIIKWSDAFQNSGCFGKTRTHLYLHRHDVHRTGRYRSIASLAVILGPKMKL